MKIAMIGQKGMPATFGGVERHVHELSTRLVAHGHEVTVYSRRWYAEHNGTTIDGVRVVSLPTIHTKHLDTLVHTFVSTLHAVVKGFDVIHYHGVGPALLSWIPRLFAQGSRVVVTFHSIDRKHKKWNWFARQMLRFGEFAACKFPHETIAVSRTIGQYARDAYDRHVTVIPNGVPVYTRARKKNHLNKWGLQSKQYVLVVSRLIAHKGIQYMIEAYKHLRIHRPSLVRGVPLVIVGDGYHSDAYVEHLKDLAGSDPQILFTGFQGGDTLAQLYSHAKLMVHPSDNEGLPLTVLEGMSYGLPLLVSDIPEHRELINDSQWNFAHGRVRSLIIKLTRILQEEKSTLDERGQLNRDIVAKNFNWETIVAETIGVYDAAVDTSVKVAPVV